MRTYSTLGIAWQHPGARPPRDIRVTLGAWIDTDRERNDA